MENVVNVEFVVLIIVAYIIGLGLKANKSIPDNWIPIIVMIATVGLALLKSFALSGMTADSIYIGITQGLLCSGMAVFGNEIRKQFNRTN